MNKEKIKNEFLLFVVKEIERLSSDNVFIVIDKERDINQISLSYHFIKVNEKFKITIENLINSFTDDELIKEILNDELMSYVEHRETFNSTLEEYLIEINNIY